MQQQPVVHFFGPGHICFGLPFDDVFIHSSPLINKSNLSCLALPLEIFVSSLGRVALIILKLPLSLPLATGTCRCHDTYFPPACLAYEHLLMVNIYTVTPNNRCNLHHVESLVGQKVITTR